MIRKKKGTGTSTSNRSFCETMLFLEMESSIRNTYAWIVRFRDISSNPFKKHNYRKFYVGTNRTCYNDVLQNIEFEKIIL